MILSFQTYNRINSLLPPKRLIWHLVKLKDDKKVATYQQVFTNLITSLIPHSLPPLHDRGSTINYIENLNSAICQAKYQSLDQVCEKATGKKILSYKNSGQLNCKILSISKDTTTESGEKHKG
jgi:hypothetical protein